MIRHDNGALENKTCTTSIKKVLENKRESTDGIDEAILSNFFDRVQKYAKRGFTILITE